jgi:hypothetical protein
MGSVNTGEAQSKLESAGLANGSARTDQGPPTLAQIEATVRRNLRGSVLRRIAGADHVRKHPDYVAYVVYAWGHEALLVVAGLGISHPVVSLFAPDDKAGGAAGAWRAMSTYPPHLLWLVVTAVALWAIVRLWVGVRKLGERGPLMAACWRELKSLDANLQDALQKEEPLQLLSDLMAESKAVVDRYFKSGVWPWPIGPEGQVVEAHINERADRLCRTCRHFWKEPT